MWLVVIIATLALPLFWFNAYRVDYQYEKAIGSYIENAYEVNTPDRMIAEIEKAIAGMKMVLSPENYGAMWFKKPDNKMAWQYDFLDSVIERAQSVQIWYDNVYKEGSQNTESLGDVYEQKMDNLREFLKENGRADWIAKDAWYVKFHPFYYFRVLISFVLIIFWSIAITISSS